MLEPRLELGEVLVRPWERRDREAVVRHGDDFEVTRYLTDRFPSPYTLAAADSWFDLCDAFEDPIAGLAIVVDGGACGGTGIERGSDLERLTGEVGYWIGREYWGRGIVARALSALTEFAFRERDFERLLALVLEGNTSSLRVLDKCGFDFESRRRRAIVKSGRIYDGLVYVRLRTDA